MTQRSKLMIIAGVAVFLLALIVGVVAYISQADPASSAEATEVTREMSTQGRGSGSDMSIYPISPRKAALIALRATPGASLVEPPTVVSFQAVVAYEVQLDSGIVYVDANNGQVLYNSAKSTSLAPAPSGS